MIVPTDSDFEGLIIGFIAQDEKYDDSGELRGDLLFATAYYYRYSTLIIYQYIDSYSRRIEVTKAAQNTILYQLRRYKLEDYLAYSNDTYFEKRTNAIKRNYREIFGRLATGQLVIEYVIDTLTSETLSYNME